jgi:hypothetical protein
MFNLVNWKAFQHWGKNWTSTSRLIYSNMSMNGYQLAKRYYKLTALHHHYVHHVPRPLNHTTTSSDAPTPITTKLQPNA